MHEEIINGVNPTLKFLLSNNTIVNIILLSSFMGFITITVLSAIKGWWNEELITNIIIMIIGSFLGASLLKYGGKK